MLYLGLLQVITLVVAAANYLEFENVGYEGTYWNVALISDIYSDSCTCELSDSSVSFSGTNAPLNEELSVHFRGPLTLSKFAYYVSSDFSIDSDDNQDWTRLAYYEGSSQTADNVTFLTNAGKNSSCLGKALTYADSDGTSEADSATVLDADTLIHSEDEYVIFSNVSCEDSGFNNDCGVYRDGIPAYHGFYGTTKMFLFEFTMPEETKYKKDEVSNWNMPAIWLLNSNIPRTSQYSNNVNCSCWRSGCGEFDIFEVKNYTSSTVKKLYSTIHDYQGTDDIETGLQVDGYFDRDYSATVNGGVLFDNDGNAVVFISNSTSFDSTIKASDIKLVVTDLGKATSLKLADVTSSGSSESSSASTTKDSAGNKVSNIGAAAFAIFSFLLF